MLKKRILVIIPVLFCFASIMSMDNSFFGDLFSHFRIFWTLLSFGILAIYSILYVQKKLYEGFLIVIILATFGLNVFLSFSFWTNSQTYEYLFFGSPDGIEYSEKIKLEIERDTTVKKLLLMNVLSSNTNYDKVKRTIKNTDADFVVIIELNQKWEKELKELNKNYPYQFTEVREDNFGMGFYAKTGTYKSYDFGSNKNTSFSTPSLYVAEIESKNEFKFVILHPILPINRDAYKSRNIYLNEVSTFMSNGIFQKTLLVGDLNCSPFSADYKKILKQSELKDSQENYGFQPTWNSSFPFLMQTQLDHVWHSNDIEILHRQTLPIEGSDHKAVLVLFR